MRTALVSRLTAASRTRSLLSNSCSWTAANDYSKPQQTELHAHGYLIDRVRGSRLYRASPVLCALNKDERKYGPPREPEDALIPWCRHVVSGVDLLRNPKYNKGMAFTEEERDRLHLRGLLPPAVMTQDLQVERVMANLRTIKSPLNKYTHLMALQERNTRLFYRVLMEHLEELMPIVYTPTVGEACRQYGLMFRRPRGLFISMADRGRISRVIRNWSETRVRTIVVTDGENVSGVGDLGVNGMGVGVSKLALYTACAGIEPHECLPVTIDVGTDNEELLQDPFYIGLRHRRVRGEAYDELMDEFVEAVHEHFGVNILIEFDEIKYQNAASILLRHRGELCCFNDDLQGTATVALAGILACIDHLDGQTLLTQTFLFAGAGQAGTSIAELIVSAIAYKARITIYEARERVWCFDSKGLVVRSRAESLEDHKLPYAQDGPEIANLAEAIAAVRPTVLIGTSTTKNKAGTFTQEVCQAMAACNERPLIMALSGRGGVNKLRDHQECSGQDAYNWTDGRCIFLGGASEDDICSKDGTPISMRRAHTAYIFPGLALGVRISGAARVRDEMLIAAAEALAAQVTPEDRQAGAIYPQFKDMREISARVAQAVACKAYELNLARELPRHPDMYELACSTMYWPSYRKYR